jgi:7-carboxy-7-deazaguanine synthase
VKFVIQDRADFDYSVDVMRRLGLEAQVPLLFSPVTGRLDPAELARWMLDSGVRARLQLQLHKILWPHAMRGV